MENLGINAVNGTVPRPSTRDRYTDSLIGHLQELGLGSRDSLSPAPQNGDSSRSRSHRRSSSRNPIPRHEVDNEPPPDSRFYSPNFQRALTQSRDLAITLADALASSDLHNDGSSAIHALHTQALDASNYSGPRSWKIGFVGDSGAGKSSLINSLLDSTSLARASNSGAACTCTVTEYHYHESPDFAIEVTYFTKERLLEQFEELLHAYREYHSRSVEAATEDEALREAASVAWHTFQAAFRGQLQLQENYLIQQDVQTLRDSFSSWIDQCAPRDGASAIDLTVVRRESSLDENRCKVLLMQLTSESAGAIGPTNWPYIKSVKVSLRAKVLSKGLIFVDLPGLRDTNSARRMITERYIVNCDEVFAIANIGRAETDEGVQAVVNLARRTQRNHVGIVCTKSDDIRAEEAEGDFEGAQLRRLRVLMNKDRDCKQRLREINNELDFEPGEDDEEEVRRLHLRRREEERTQRDTEFQLMKHLITVRNEKVTSTLLGIERYQPIVQHVFCVSNATYRDRRDGTVEWLNLSGIISLRRHCLGLVAEHQLQEGTNFISEIVPNLVSSLDLWVQSGSGRIAAETREQVRQASRNLERNMQKELVSVTTPHNRVFTVVDGHYRNHVANHFTNDKDRAWRTTAIQANRDWSGWHHASFAAFCRNYGDHSTKTIGSRCWNEEIIKGMTNELSQPWDGFRNQVKGSFRQRSNAIEQCFDQSLATLQCIELAVADRDNSETLETLITTLSQRKNILFMETHAVIAEYELALSRFGNVDFLSGIQASLIGQHMEPAYAAAIRESGSGSDSRRKQIIGNKVQVPDLFDNIGTKVQLQVQTLALDIENKVREVSTKHFDAVRTALDTLRNENAVLEAERDPGFRERMREQVMDAQRRVQELRAAV